MDITLATKQVQAAGDTLAEEESFYQDIKLLQSHGVNVADCRYQEVEGCWDLHSRRDSDDNDKEAVPHQRLV